MSVTKPTLNGPLLDELDELDVLLEVLLELLLVLLLLPHATTTNAIAVTARAIRTCDLSLRPVTRSPFYKGLLAQP